MMKATSRTKGILYIVATPIGNLGDLSVRARTVLGEVDEIIAEDTRHTQILLNELGIKKPLTSLHAYNEESKSTKIVQDLLAGTTFALVSDAGTPLISDPGYPLVKQARTAGIDVIPLPGPCAFVAALSAAGVPCDTFTFAGFLPAKTHARQQKLKTFYNLPHTLVFYESTHRILACLDDINAVFGAACELVLAKELTKTFERFVTGTSEEIKAWLRIDSMHCKGEFVIIVPPREIAPDSDHVKQLLQEILLDLPLKTAVNIACQVSGMPKNEVYKLALNLQEK